MSKLDKRRKGVYGPPLGKKFIIFVDDINLPAMDPVGSKGAIELLRQMMDHKIWYDNKELFSMKIVDTGVIAAIVVIAIAGAVDVVAAVAVRFVVGVACAFASAAVVGLIFAI